MYAALTALLLASPASAIPGQFTHQGRLLAEDGAPLADATTITFRVMDAESGGETLWEETLTLSLTNGFYAAVLGADEESNPLDVEILSQAPVWLELQLTGEASMSPRSPIHSVPYAAMATVAEELSGGPVDASRVAVDGTLVINESGEWVGPSSTVTWSDIEGIPAGFADGVDDDTDTDTDTDTLADLALSCSDGDIPVWDAVLGAWTCDIDQDTLAMMDCADGQLIHWSNDIVGWVCGNDYDSTLTEDEVDAMVADNGFAMATDLFSGSYTDLTDIPADIADGDDDTVLTEDAVDAMVADNGFALATDLFSGSYTDLTDIPADIADGDDDTVLTEDEVDAMVADNGYLTSADLVGSGGSGTVIYTRCAWTGDYMPITGSCTPPACPEPWEDLGITGNVKAALAAYGSADYSSSYSESAGYQERGCFLDNSVTVLVTRCAWSGAIAPDIGTCTPPGCPSGWVDLGITGNIKSALGMYGSADYSSSYSESGGYQERTCTR